MSHITMLDFISILELAGFDREPLTKMVRHQDPKFDLDLLRRNNNFEQSQASQDKPVFDSNKSCRSMVYLVLKPPFTGYSKFMDTPLVHGSEGIDGPFRYRDAQTKILYDLERDTRFDFLHQRPASAVQLAAHDFALRFEAETCALALCAHSQVADESACRQHSHPCTFTSTFVEPNVQG